MPRVFLQRQVHVAETDAKAHEETRAYLGNGGGGVFTIGGGDVGKTRIGWGSNPRAMGRDSERPDDKARGETLRRAANDYQFNLDSGLAIVGSPETVIEKLEAGRKTIGYDVFCTSHEFGRMPKELCAKSVELFGKHVIPAFERTNTVPLQVAAE
jgi:alkanesulfonate monooxygenase SsuD/methylene tetrahydromethanopterin reductase-like flavin-dependent oxidoreductase (luciferase family)